MDLSGPGIDVKLKERKKSLNSWKTQISCKAESKTQSIKVEDVRRMMDKNIKAFFHINLGENLVMHLFEFMKNHQLQFLKYFQKQRITWCRFSEKNQNQRIACLRNQLKIGAFMK